MRRSLAVISVAVAAVLVGGGLRPAAGPAGRSRDRPERRERLDRARRPTGRRQLRRRRAHDLPRPVRLQPHRPGRPDRPPEHGRDVAPAPVLRQPDDQRDIDRGRSAGRPPRAAPRRQLRLLGPDAVPERRRRPGPVRADLLPRRLAPELRGHPALPARPADDRRQRHGHRALPTDAVAWMCQGMDNLSPAPPNCGGGTVLQIRFPDCWDGRNLDSADHKSHMAYTVGGGCPSNYPVPVRCSSSTSATRRSATPG